MSQPPSPINSQSAGMESYPVTIGLLVLIGVVYAITSFPTFAGPSEFFLDEGCFVSSLVAQGEYWRIITGNLMHANPSHLFNNAFGIYIFGHMLEPMMGSKRIFLLLILSGLLCDLLTFFLLPNPSLGASGLAYGLLMAYVTYNVILERQFNPKNNSEQLRSITGFCLVYFGWGFMDTSVPVNAWGHLGGGIAGLIFGLWYTQVTLDQFAGAMGIRLGLLSGALRFLGSKKQ